MNHHRVPLDDLQERVAYRLLPGKTASHSGVDVRAQAYFVLLRAELVENQPGRHKDGLAAFQPFSPGP